MAEPQRLCHFTWCGRRDLILGLDALRSFAALRVHRTLIHYRSYFKPRPLTKQNSKVTRTLLFYLRVTYEKDTKLKADELKQKRMTFCQSGFNFNDIGDKPAIRLEQLWAGAFIANCRKTSSTVIKELRGKMKDQENLFKTLTEMYQNALSNLLPDEDDAGNVEWTATN